MVRGSDPRLWQIGVLSTLLGWGLLGLDFEVEPLAAAATLAAALAMQALCARVTGARFEARSALISGLSTALLLRADALWIPPAAAALAIAGKFALRWNGRHLWNPSCLAIVVTVWLVDGAWVSAGQWGSHAIFALAAAGLGALVVHRAERSDVTWAFLAFHAALQLGRATWLGDPLAIPLHGLRNGALLIFAFHMISDPRTVPATRGGRVLFAAVVATTAFGLQHGLWAANPLLLALTCAAPLVPAIDRWLASTRKETDMRFPIRTVRTLAQAGALAFALLLGTGDAGAFCGFYVAKADTKLFNEASQVVLVRDGDRTVVTMSNDYRGAAEEFAMVIPVPTFVERGQINVGDRKVIDHLDAYTSPRLVEYFDPDPCARWERFALEDRAASAPLEAEMAQRKSARAEGVTIEATYTVGEYDILILSAEQSDGLARWLRGNGYRLPDGAEKVLASYIRQDMRFFVAKVNLEEHSKLGVNTLRPLQVAYESPKFMLPIRLGTLNADGPQELFVYTLTRKGRVETTNYRTVKLPTGQEVPPFVKGEFGDFYKALFSEQVRREDMRVVFTEYAWDMAWCDPCAADPLSVDELRGLGVFWVNDSGGPARDVFVTRLHVRYDEERFPADLVFQETGDRSNFQGRYVLRHAWTGNASCAAAEAYRRQLRERREKEARTLASLTGWSIADIRRKLSLGGEPGNGDPPWWQGIWR